METPARAGPETMIDLRRRLRAGMTPEQVRAIRARAGLTQLDLAQILNTTDKNVCRWEGGHTRPSGPLLRLLRIAEERGIDSIR